MGYQLPISPDSITIAGHIVPLGGSQNLAASDLTNGTTGSGEVVLETSPTINSPTLSGAVAGTAAIPNGVLQNSSVTISNNTLALGGSLSLTATDISSIGAIAFNVMDYGALGNSNPDTDDAPAIQAALDAAYDAAKTDTSAVVFIPDAPRQSNGLPGFYNCKASLLLNWGQHMTGEGMWTTNLHFPSDTNGIQIIQSESPIMRQLVIEKLNITGNAPLSTNSATTIGIYLLNVAYTTVKNVIINDFVDGIHFADSTGPVTCYNVYVFESNYPNPINGYPKNLCRLTGDDDGKAQGVYLHACEFWANTLADVLRFNGTEDGQTVFQWTDGNFSGQWVHGSGGGSGIYAASGIKVYVDDGGGVPRKKLVQGTDYSLYNISGESPVLIEPGATYVGATALQFEFAVAPLTSQTVTIWWNDPSADCGVYLDYSNLNVIDATVSGCNAGFQDVLGNNYFTPYCATSQICNTLFVIGGPDNIYEQTRQSNEDVETQFEQQSRGTYPTGMAPGCGRDWTENLATETFTTSSLDYVIITSFSGNGLSYTERTSGFREVQFEGGYALTNTSGGDTAADVLLNVSYDGGNTWSNLAYQRIEANLSATAATRGRVTMNARDSVFMQPLAGSMNTIQYQVQTRLRSGTSVSWEVSGGGGFVALRARSVNPN